MFKLRTSIHGRRMGISSSGALITATSPTGAAGSSAFKLAAQMWGEGMFEDVGPAASTMSNFGISTISSGTATAPTGWQINAPVRGVFKEIHIHTSASEISINGTSTDIRFKPENAGGSSVGTTLFLNSTRSGNISGGIITLRGHSTSLWGVMGHNNRIGVNLN